MIYLQLFYEFFKIGLFSIGGGFSTLPFLYVLADKYPWFSREMLVKMIAVSESTPGPIGINMATFAGYNAAGILGGITATFAVVTPSVIILLFAAKALFSFKDNKYVRNAFYGLRPVVCALIAYAGVNIAREMIDYKQIIMFAVMLTAYLRFEKIKPLYLFVFAAVVGIIFKF